MEKHEDNDRAVRAVERGQKGGLDQPSTTIRVLDFIPVWEISGSYWREDRHGLSHGLKNESGRCDKNSSK